MMKGKTIIAIESEKHAETIKALKVDNKVLVRNFKTALQALIDSKVDHVVCDYNLLDPDCMEFMSEIKNTSSYSPELVVTFSSLKSKAPERIPLDPHETDDFINSLYSSEESEEIFSLGDLPELSFKLTEGVFEKIYLYSFEIDHLLLGARGVKASELPGSLEVVLDHCGEKKELTLTGSYEEVESFCEDQDDMFFLKFIFEGGALWEEFVQNHNEGMDALNKVISDNFDLD